MSQSSVLQQFLAPLREAIRKLTARERILLLALANAVALFGITEVFDRASSEEIRLSAAHEALRQERERVRVRADERALGAVTRAIAKAQALSFRAETLAIARVRAQTVVTNAAAAAGIVGARVTAAPEALGEGRVRLQPLTVQGAFNWATFLPFAQALAGTEESILITKFSVDASASPQFELVLLAPLAVMDSAATSGPIEEARLP